MTFIVFRWNVAKPNDPKTQQNERAAMNGRKNNNKYFHFQSTTNPTRSDHKTTTALCSARFSLTSNIFRQLSRFTFRRVWLAYYYIGITISNMRLLVFAAMHTKISCSIRQFRTNVLQSIKNCLHTYEILFGVFVWIPLETGVCD